MHYYESVDTNISGIGVADLFLYLKNTIAQYWSAQLGCFIVVNWNIILIMNILNPRSAWIINISGIGIVASTFASCMYDLP